MADGYRALIRELSESLFSDLMAGSWNGRAKVEDAVARLPELVLAGDLDAGAVASLSDALRSGPPPPVRFDVSEVNLAAARIVADPPIAREAALARARVALELAVGLDPREQARAIVQITDAALELAAEFDFESTDPQLVAELYLQAGNPFMASRGPTDIQQPRGLARFLEGHRIKKAIGAADLPELERLMTDAARFLMESLSLPMLDRSEIAERVERATEVFAAVGATQDLRAARLELLRLAAEAHALGTADATASALAADGGLDADERRALALYTADLRTQQIRPADALRELDGAAVGEDDPRWTYAETIRGNALRLAGDLSGAEAAFRAVADRLAPQQAERPGDVGLRGSLAHALAHVGMLAFQQGRVEYGRSLFAEVDALFEDGVMLDVPRLEFGSLAATSLLEAGLFDEAEERLDAALDLRRSLEEAMSDPTEREHFLATWSRLDERRAALLLRRGDAAEAFATIEEAKSRVLRGVARRRLPGRPASGETVAAQRAAWAMVSAEKRQRAAELEGMAIGDPARSALAAEVRRLARHADGLRRLLEHKAMASVAIVEAQTPDTSVAEDADLLAPSGTGWTMVSYFGSEQGLGVTVRTGDRIDGCWLDDPSYARLRDEILQPLGRAREGLGKSVSQADWEATLEAALRDLHDALVAPVEPMLSSHGAERLLIVPHRALHTVPFGALTDADGAAVIDRYAAVAVVPGVRLVAGAVRSRGAPVRGEVVVFAAPDAAVPLTAAEAQEVAATWAADQECTPTVGGDANPGALFGAAPQARLLHLACHGVWDAAHPQLSGLRLALDPSGSPPLFGAEPGLVNPGAILTQLDLTSCRLAVLSACDTGLSRVSIIDEPLSLPLLLLLAGTRSAIASLWPVRDDSTLLLMSELHRLLRDGSPPWDALAGAQRSLRAMTSEEATARLDRARADLEASELGDEARTTAKRVLADAVEHAGRAASPYAHPDHWAAFACTGAPGADQPEEPNP